MVQRVQTAIRALSVALALLAAEPLGAWAQGEPQLDLFNTSVRAGGTANVPGRLAVGASAVTVSGVSVRLLRGGGQVEPGPDAPRQGQRLEADQVFEGDLLTYIAPENPADLEAVVELELRFEGGRPPLRARATVTILRFGVAAFRAGTQAFDGTHWGGAGTGFNSHCEGLVRQELGLLDPDGRPQPVPNIQQIVIEGQVVGFTDANRTRRAFNLDLVPFRTVLFNAIGDTLYSCGHGQRAGEGRKGGVIVLDRGESFDGFTAPGFPDGTAASDAPPYPELGFGIPIRTQVHLHHCWSGRDPDQNPAAAPHAVSRTLSALANVAVPHAHQNPAVAGIEIGWRPGPSAGELTQDAVNRALTAAHEAIDAARFPDHYGRGQAALDGAVGAGQMVLQLRYADMGEGTDPGRTVIARSGCPEEDVFSTARGEAVLQFGDEQTAVIPLEGSLSVQAELASQGDWDDNQLEQIRTEIVAMQLCGAAWAPQVCFRVRPSNALPFRASTGTLEEDANVERRRLDLPPFAPRGTARALYHAFLEVELPRVIGDGGVVDGGGATESLPQDTDGRPPEAQVLYHLDPLVLACGSTYKPAGAGDRCTSLGGVELLTAEGPVARLVSLEVTPRPLVPFEQLTARVISRPGIRPRAGHVQVRAAFVLGRDSNGLAPLTEPLRFRVGSFEATFPPGTLAPDPRGGFRLWRVVEGIPVRLRVAPLGDSRWELEAALDRVQVADAPLVSIIIGDDGGSTVAGPASDPP